MDTVTYPDPALREWLDRFILVKVDFDRAPELVKQFNVQPLPDVRLLAPDGKQLDRLIGFSSPARLTTHLRGALDRLAGAKNDDVAPPSALYPPLALEAVTEEACAQAVQRGAGFLRSAARTGWTAEARFSPDELVLLAWSCAGVRSGDADFDALLARVVAAEPPGTYRAALRAVALERVDAAAHRGAIEKCARYLERTQLANGQWSYGALADGSVALLGDASNSAFALLGLAAAKKAGIAVEQAVVERAVAAWQHAQNADGGFGYRADRENASYASMTENALASLLLAQQVFGIEPEKIAAARTGAAEWSRRHFAIERNEGSAYQEGRLLYHLYALERVGAFDGEHAFVAADWHRRGAAFLLANQQNDGSFDDGADTPIANTCFALLFLTHATDRLR